MSEPAYCTILARNYLPKALVLADSLRRFGATVPLTIFLIDADHDDEFPDTPGVRWMCPADLDALDEREVLDLAMAYDLVEFATALKPLVLRQLLDAHERVGYLDPDTYLLSPMSDLVPALDASSGVVLTPHYLAPVPAGNEFGEGHLLAVGVYNLGFCLLDRRGVDFLDWWWGHLRTECLHDYIAGLFVDQKWVDIGSVLFEASALRHAGYNVSVANLHERPVVLDGDEYRIATFDVPLRLFHFHAFDSSRPDELPTRLLDDSAHQQQGSDAIGQLCRQYAAELIVKERECGPAPAYRYSADTSGRPIPRRLRHAHRVAVRDAGERRTSIPSPFLAQDADAFREWRRGAVPLTVRLMLSDVAKGVRCALPEEWAAVRKRAPRLTGALRRRYADDSGMWG